MSGFSKGRAAIPTKPNRKPWERSYAKLTPLRAKMPTRSPTYGEVHQHEMTTFKAKTGLGGKRHRARRRAIGGGS